jgi:hypothetical protein
VVCGRICPGRARDVLPATLDEHDGDTFVEDGFVFVVS